MHAHTLALNHGGTCWSHPISTYAQCIRKGELIHILSLSIALCLIVRHLFCNSHQGDKRQQSHASSCSPLLLRLCAGSCFADQWLGSGAGHKAPQIKERENREEWGLPPSGDLPLRQRGRKGEAGKRKRLWKAKTHNPPFSHSESRRIRAWMWMWGHGLTAEPYLLSPREDTAGLDSARFSQGRIGDLRLLR